MRNLSQCRLWRRSRRMGMFAGPRPSAPGNQRCATACAILNIIISSLRGIAAQETSTFISLEPTASVLATTFGCKMEMSCKSAPRVTAALCETRCGWINRNQFLSALLLWDEWNHVKTKRRNSRTRHHGFGYGQAFALRELSVGRL